MKLLIAALIGLCFGFIIAALSGCSLYKTAKSTTKIVGETVTFSQQVDDVQAALAGYDEQPILLYRIDQWQKRFAKAMKGEVNTTIIKSLYSEAIELYDVAYQVADDDWDTATPELQEMLLDLNKRALNIDSDVKAYLSDPETVDTKKLMGDLGDLVYYGFKIGKAYKEFK